MFCQSRSDLPSCFGRAFKNLRNIKKPPIPISEINTTTQNKINHKNQPSKPTMFTSLLNIVYEIPSTKLLVINLINVYYIGFCKIFHRPCPFFRKIMTYIGQGGDKHERIRIFKFNVNGILSDRP